MGTHSINLGRSNRRAQNYVAWIMSLADLCVKLMTVKKIWWIDAGFRVLTACFLTLIEIYQMFYFLAFEHIHIHCKIFIRTPLKSLVLNFFFKL